MFWGETEAKGPSSLIQTSNVARDSSNASGGSATSRSLMTWPWRIMAPTGTGDEFHP